MVPVGGDAALRSAAAAGAGAEEVRAGKTAGRLWQPWLAVSTVRDFFFVTHFGDWWVFFAHHYPELGSFSISFSSTLGF